jgi:hypothetical protein
MRTTLFCAITQLILVIPNTFEKKLSVPSSRVDLSLKMGHISSPETSVRNHLYTLRNSLRKRRSQCEKHVPAVTDIKK